MATTLSDIKERLAYRLGENSTPSDSNENARRNSFINEGHRKVCNDRRWWFLQKRASDTSVDGQEIYTLPTDYVDMIELRLDGNVATFTPQYEAFANYNYPPLFYQYRSVTQHWFAFGETDLHLIPIPSSAPSALTVSSITRSGDVATATTSTAHGWGVNTYVTIAGANQTDYNGAFRVTSVPSTTTFTFDVENEPTTPATGTITATERNIVYRYWYFPSDLSSDTDTIAIPDRYSDILVAYALGKKMGGPIEDERGSAGDAFEEFNSILDDMRKGHTRWQVYNKVNEPLDPYMVP